jgi:hypothetical protein
MKAKSANRRTTKESPIACSCNSNSILPNLFHQIYSFLCLALVQYFLVLFSKWKNCLNSMLLSEWILSRLKYLCNWKYSWALVIQKNIENFLFIGRKIIQQDHFQVMLLAFSPSINIEHLYIWPTTAINNSCMVTYLFIRLFLIITNTIASKLRTILRLKSLFS